MSLTPGTRLGVYEVTAAIGQGGMGEVYRARDTRLKRDVALKILPASYAMDADRLARFFRLRERSFSKWKQRRNDALRHLSDGNASHLFQRLRVDDG